MKDSYLILDEYVSMLNGLFKWSRKNNRAAARGAEPRDSERDPQSVFVPLGQHVPR